MKILAAAAVYLAAVNLISFLLFAADKKKAVKGRYRISEDLLLTTALIGGELGAFAAMRVFHHKTKHKKFTVGLPVIFIFHISAAILVLYISKL